MRVAVTGASGLIGRPLVAALEARGDEITVLSRDPQRGVTWDPLSEAAPAEALSGRDVVIHLAAENIAQRWSDKAKRLIRDSRVIGTENLLAGIAAASPRPGALISASAVGYYGDRGDEALDEDASAGSDWVAEICVDWERTAAAGADLGLRVCLLRTGVVLSRHGGALAKMLPPFRAGVGGPVAGGQQYMSWIALEDIVDLYLAAADDGRFTGALNATAPAPVTNAEFSKALGRALHRPAVAPVPRAALRLLFGEMAQIVTGGQRVYPARAAALGFDFRHPDLDGALEAALAE
ncbi:MAG: TIGR01777 family oxidoreductase [Solirubrobacteraceae bacterium]